MWIVRLALRRPYTFVVVSVLMLLLGIGTCIEAPKDIYPYIDIPAVTMYGAIADFLRRRWKDALSQCASVR